MIGILRVLTALAVLNNVKMFKLSSSYLHKSSRTFLHTMKKESVDLKSLSNFYKPRSANQESYVKYLNDQRIKLLFAFGPAGTGKTMLACNHAIKELKNGNVQKIVITRPVVPVEEEEIGFLPGNINKKMDPWMRPVFDIFYEFYQKRDVETMLYNNVIEISPLAFMRGRTFKHAYIIADEMQNSSPNQMLMLTTRIGDGSKMIITGDLKQSDRGMESGLYDFIKKYKTYQNYLSGLGINSTSEIKIVELENCDIERSKVINKLLDIYDFNESLALKKSITSSLTIQTQPANDMNPGNDMKPGNDEKLGNDAKPGNETKTRRETRHSNNDAALIPIAHMSGRVRE